jgi:hypothetical protein
MSGDWLSAPVAEPDQPVDFDTSIAHPARVYDFWLGGKDNFAADRAAGSAAAQANPAILTGVRANRAFLARAVRLLTGAGIRQFLDVGTGLPSADHTHEVAQAAAPESRIVYVDNDPIVLAHARALLSSTPEGATAYIDADARDVDMVLRKAAETLDFSQPVAVMALMVMQYVADADDPHSIIARLVGATVPGSYLVLSDTVSDVHAEVTSVATARLNERLGPVQLTRRPRAEIERYFAGLDLVEPGVVPLNRWRPPPGGTGPAEDLPAYCGMGRKP